MLDFKQPIDSPFVLRTTKALTPFILRFRCHDLKLHVLADGVERFRALKGKHVMICPNHSFRHDPEVMLAFSNLIGEDFHFVAAREVFDYNHGVNGWLLQRMGVYSVVRGAADRESFKTTKSILVEGKRKLVLFPEGELSWQNETLLPLETGAVQLSYWAQDELQKTQPEEPVMIVPIALKYTYRNNISQTLEVAITKLEKRLDIEPKLDEGLYSRVRAAALKVLCSMERQYNLKAKDNDSLNDRMNKLKEQIMHQMAEVLEVELPPLKSSYLDWVRVLRNTMDDFIYGDTAELSAYEKRLHDERAKTIKTFYRDLDRVVAFVAIYDGYLSPPATQERMAAVVEMLEQEVFGEKTVFGPRLVTLDVGEPINLLDQYAGYKKAKREVLQNVTNDLSKRIHGLLDNLEQQRTPVHVS